MIKFPIKYIFNYLNKWRNIIFSRLLLQMFNYLFNKSLLGFIIILLNLYSYSNPFIIATFSWPRARIPFEDDSRLTSDYDMSVALNNARMDLQARTCIRLVPRKTEKDYVLFTDLGQNIECWNMFEPLPPKGQILVNAGPSCLEPMRRPHRPKRVFSECDIEYVNHLYNCPKRRKSSPICPTGRLIMSKPDEYFENKIIEKEKNKSLFKSSNEEEINSIGEGGGRGGNNDEDIIIPLNEKEEEEEYIINKNRERPPFISISIEEETEELEYSTTELPTTTITIENEKIITTESNIENTTEEIEQPLTTTFINKITENYESTTEDLLLTTTTPLPISSSTLSNNILEQELSTSIINEEKLILLLSSTTTSTSSPLDISLFGSTSSSSFETNISPFNTPSSSSSSSLNKFGESLGGVIGRQPFPLMFTLIRTTTTTTIIPPTPDWVRSVEESFLAGEQLGEENNKNKIIIGEKPHGDGWKILSTIKPLLPLQPLILPKEVEVEEIKEDNQSGGIDSSSIPFVPMPIKPGIISIIRNNTKINNQNEDEEELSSSFNNIKEDNNNNNKGPPIQTIFGIIEFPPGSAISIKEKTKITKLIEKTKYIGPCGSACTYGGQLVHLYRSFNNNPQILNHFYTTERLEQHLMGAQGFVMEPSMGFLGKNQIDPNCTCIQPLYRLYSEFAKDYFLTSNENEKNIAETLLGYSFEKILGYCTKEPGCGAYLPLYRFYNAINKDHFYTIDQQEMNYYKTHAELAYGFEKIECYVWKKSLSSKGCPAFKLEIQEDEERRKEENEDNNNNSSSNNKSFSNENLKIKRRRRKRKEN